ncbi:hypothetical protein FisN_30Lh125 [Fistulifera solaris]|uniref:Glycosyltransferase 2-like domain-containing protein n=1 Tax=Fistulifera solaris TaxID=1519565 RepID=A0A1Z5JII8_FISSO|nr:hypothetical protein FisN_30Lh125 [Fistulifera solaris]|eukprot:GAX13827.1 hypothetical protein FisN_30Lh125 [Fistulifera solaris]
MVRHPERFEPSESSDTISPQVTLPFNEDTSYVYEPLPISKRMQQKRALHLKEDSTEFDEEEGSNGIHDKHPSTFGNRNDSTTAWISRRLYTSNGWRLINTYLITPCSGALCSSRICRSLYQNGHFTPLGREVWQLGLVVFIFHLIPMFLYFLFDLIGLNVSFGVYVATMIFLVTMSFLLLTECLCAFGHSGPPKAPGVPETPASAIICAYLPNEAEIIVEAVEHFLNLEYEPGIQIILAYNTPVRIPAVEEQLEVLANRFPNLLVLCIENSTSKAQNINAALDFVVGDFVGVFDADHRPELHSFSRAWRWLSNGYDVVQGHSVSRNAKASWMARLMAVEAECHYAVSVPGQTTRDKIGFYRSNGYWKSPLFKRIGMLASMKAEDVDAGMMALGEGRNIAMDPQLISLDLSATTPFQIWNQRIRLAQGWFQVSMRHCFPLLFCPALGVRQKLGIFLHLNVREMFPWFSSQVFTLVFYWLISDRNRDLIRPLLLAYITYLLVEGPLTALAAYCLCQKTMRNPWWFVQYALFNIFFFAAAKGLFARMGHIKQATGENIWRVTPRSTKAIHTAQPEHVFPIPQEAEIKAIGEPSMTVLTIQKVAQSTQRNMKSVLQESRLLFQERLDRTDRSRHHFSRQEDESMMIAKHKLHHIVQRCDWSYAITNVDCLVSTSPDGSQSDADRGRQGEEYPIENKISGVTRVAPNHMRRPKSSWVKSERVKVVDKRNHCSRASESSSDSQSRGKAYAMDWSFQNMDGDYSVSVQRADYGIPVSPVDQSVSLQPSDHSDSIRTYDMSTSQAQQYKPRTTRFQKVFNFSKLFSGSVSSRGSSDLSSSKNSLHTDFSKSIDENGPGAFWTRTKETSIADEHSSSTVSEAQLPLQDTTEMGLENGLEENGDVQRLQAQNLAAAIIPLQNTIGLVSSNIKKGFAFDPPSSSISETDVAFRPDPPLKEVSQTIQKDGIQPTLAGQPLKEQYWKKRGRYWATNSDKSGSGATPSGESSKPHRVRRDPEGRRKPQKRRHRDAPSKLGRIYTIEESQDGNASDETGNLDVLSYTPNEIHSGLRCADPPAEEMPSTSHHGCDISIQTSFDSAPIILGACYPSHNPNLAQQSDIKPLSDLSDDRLLQASHADAPAELIKCPYCLDLDQNVTIDEDSEAGRYGTKTESEEEGGHSVIIASTTTGITGLSFDEVRVDRELQFVHDRNEVLEYATLISQSGRGNCSVSTSNQACSDDALIAEVVEQGTEFTLDEKAAADPLGYADKAVSEYTVDMQARRRDDASIDRTHGSTDIQAGTLYSCSDNNVMYSLEQHDDTEASEAMSEGLTECSCGPESKGCASMYSFISKAEDAKHLSTINVVDCISIDSSDLIDCDEMCRSTKIIRVDTNSEYDIAESVDEHLCAKDPLNQFLDANSTANGQHFGDGHDLVALQEMMALEMNREYNATDNYVEAESDTRLDDRGFKLQPLPTENEPSKRRSFFKELPMTAALDELSEGVSAKHDQSSFSSRSQPKTLNVITPRADGLSSPSKNKTSRRSHEQIYFPFRPPVHIELDDVASLSDSVSFAGMTIHSCSQSHSATHIGDFDDVPKTDDHLSVGCDPSNDAYSSTLEIESEHYQDTNSCNFVLEGHDHSTNSTSNLQRGSFENVHESRVYADLAAPIKNNLNEYCFREVSHEYEIGVTEKPDYSDPPAKEKSGVDVASSDGDEQLLVKPTLCSNMRISTSQSTADEESAVTVTEENIHSCDATEHSTSWIQNLLDTMDEEIIFSDTLLPFVEDDDEEVPDLLPSVTEQDTFQTASSQSYDEPNNRNDWVGDEVSTVDLTVN